MPTVVRSHAKINLGLGIGAPRPDGFHSLATVYQTLEVHDIVTVTAHRAPATTLHLTSDHPRVPTDHTNTAWKIISLALDELRVTADVTIHIDKRLPVQGGLGAGSANAAATLIGLERELGIASQPQTGGPPGLAFEARESTTLNRPIPNQPPIPADWPTRRLQIAAQVGSDVPLFLLGGTVLGLDRGQQVYPLPDLEPVWCVLALPETGVSTPQAFRDWDTLCATEGLTPAASTDKLNKLSRAYLSAFGIPLPEARPGSSGVLAAGKDLAGPATSALVRTGITSWIQNDFERVVFPQHPSLADIKRLLAAPDTPEAALYASLSGSGSALFGLYQTRGDAEAVVERLGKQFRGVEARLTQTLPCKDYWSRMIVE